MSAPLDLDAIRERARQAAQVAVQDNAQEAVREIREGAREAARVAGIKSQASGRMWERCADAASDVWQAEVDRLRAESVPRSSLVPVSVDYWDVCWPDGSFVPQGTPVYAVREATE